MTDAHERIRAATHAAVLSISQASVDWAMRAIIDAGLCALLDELRREPAALPEDTPQKLAPPVDERAAGFREGIGAAAQAVDDVLAGAGYHSLRIRIAAAIRATLEPGHG